MNIGTVTYQLPGGVRLLRTTKNLSKAQIQQQIQAAQSDSVFGQCFCHLPNTTKNHDVTLQETYCTVKQSISKEVYNSIVNAKSWRDNTPSKSALRQHGLKNLEQYFRMLPMNKLHVYFSDHAADINAVKFEIELFK